MGCGRVWELRNELIKKTLIVPFEEYGFSMHLVNEY